MHSKKERTNKNYEKGQSPYQDWLSQHNGFDALETDNFSEGASPWAPGTVSEKTEEQFKALKKIAPKLKGQQKEIIKMVLSGQTSQTAIGVMLGISQQRVGRILRQIRKIIEEEMDV